MRIVSLVPLPAVREMPPNGSTEGDGTLLVRSSVIDTSFGPSYRPIREVSQLGEELAGPLGAIMCLSSDNTRRV